MSAGRTPRTRALATAIGITLVLAGTCFVVFEAMSPGVVELQFPDDHLGIVGAIEKGWLPSWFPPAASGIHGAQEIFDEDFVWSTFQVPEGQRDFLERNCVARGVHEVELPSAKFIRRFPARVQQARAELEGGAVTFYACDEDFFAALDADRARVHIWSF